MQRRWPGYHARCHDVPRVPLNAIRGVPLPGSGHLRDVQRLEVPAPAKSAKTPQTRGLAWLSLASLSGGRSSTAAEGLGLDCKLLQCRNNPSTRSDIRDPNLASEAHFGQGLGSSAKRTSNRRTLQVSGWCLQHST